MASGAEEDETLICRACGKPLREGEPCYRTLDKKRFNAIPAHHYDLILLISACRRLTASSSIERFRIDTRMPPHAVFMTAQANLEEYAPFVSEVRAPVLRKPFCQEEFRAMLSRMIGPGARRP
jgi:CheY-like chemotaxis protein